MEIPIIPKATSLHIHTGNVVNWNRLQKTIIKEPSDELKEYISSTIALWLTANKQQLDSIQDESKLKLCATSESNALSVDDRESHKVTVKLFLNDFTESTIKDAINSVLEELETNHIETVLICLPEKQRTQENLLECWRTLENMHSKLMVFSFGTVDLTQIELESFYEAVEVKPSINQVNLASCCVMPAKMIEYANQNDIQLLTHSDPSNILEHESLQQIIGGQLTAEDGKHWTPRWIARYSVLIKCRGIIASKAYIISAVRSLQPDHVIT